MPFVGRASRHTESLDAGGICPPNGQRRARALCERRSARRRREDDEVAREHPLRPHQTAVEHELGGPGRRAEAAENALRLAVERRVVLALFLGPTVVDLATGGRRAEEEKGARAPEI